MNKFFLLAVLFLFAFQFLPANQAASAPERPERSIEEQQRDILRFGTETEIAALIQTLRRENADYLNEDLIQIAQGTRNRSILTGVLGFFSDTRTSGLEDRAIRAIRERDQESNDTVMAAINYLGHVQAYFAADILIDLINTGENRFLNTAIRALGRVGGADIEAKAEIDTEIDTEYLKLRDRVALFLLDYFENQSPSDENRREIIVALGATGSSEGVPFLVELASNNDERQVLRIAALEAIAAIGDDKGLDAVVVAISSTEPLVRASAVAALGPFSGGAVDEVIMDAFRDSFYRTRIGAAQAAGQRRLESAIPFLRFRAENDESPLVRDAAIQALGAINNEESMLFLESLFVERRNSDRIRINAADMLLRNDADSFGQKVFTEMQDARRRNQMPLYNGFVRILTTARSPVFEDIALHFIAEGGVIERSLALDLVLNNEFRGLANEVRSLMDERRYGPSIARKARSTLERLGLEVEVEDLTNSE